MSPSQFQAAAERLDAGDTPWFVARYGRAATGGLSVDQMLRVRSALSAARALEGRKDAALRGMALISPVPDRIEKQIRGAQTQVELSDILLAHQPRNTEGDEVEQALAALAALARSVRDAAVTPDALPAELAKLVGQAPSWQSNDDVLAAVCSLLADEYSASALLRQRLRSHFVGNVALAIGAASPGQGPAQPTPKEYQPLLGTREPLGRLSPYRLLFLLRGEREHHISLRFELDPEAFAGLAYQTLVPPRHPHTELLQRVAREAIDRTIFPALEKEARQELQELVLNHMERIYGKSLRMLLMQKPLRGAKVLGIHYGHRQGSPIAVVDDQGAVLAVDLVSIVPVAEVRTAAKASLAALVKEHGIAAVAIGSGIGKREIEEFVSEMIREHLTDVSIGYVSVNDGGVGAYASGPSGREDLPLLEPGARAAVSLARRLLDSLNECLKIEPFNFGVGLYQQEVKSKELRPRLEEIASECVNRVGLDVNKAPAGALRYVSGLSLPTAKRIVELRKEHGLFKSRQELNERAALTADEFRQSSGFLRVIGGENPLDATNVHPQDYADAERLYAHLSAGLIVPTPVCTETSTEPVDGAAVQTVEASSSVPVEVVAKKAKEMSATDRTAAANALGMPLARVQELLSWIADAAIDPREKSPDLLLRRAPLAPEDLTEGGSVIGSVVNVVDFGVFVDIGLRDSALVHISHLSKRFVRDPHEFVCPGDPVQVWVTQINRDKGRISLSMIPPGEADAAPEGKPARDAGRRRSGGKGGGRGGRPGHVQEKQAGNGVAAAERGMEFPASKGVQTLGGTESKQSGAASKGAQPMRSFAELHATIDEQKKQRREAAKQVGETLAGSESEVNTPTEPHANPAETHATKSNANAEKTSAENAAELNAASEATQVFASPQADASIESPGVDAADR